MSRTDQQSLALRARLVALAIEAIRELPWGDHPELIKLIEADLRDDGCALGVGGIVAAVRDAHLEAEAGYSAD